MTEYETTDEARNAEKPWRDKDPEYADIARARCGLKPAETVEEGGYVNQDHANGVACGIRWAADELESVLNDGEAQEWAKHE